MMKVCLLVCMLQLMTRINADGMIEVFKWKQIDFYNRGDGANVQKDSDQVYFPGPSVRYSGHKNRLQSDRSYVQPNKMDSNQNKVHTASYIPYNNVPIGVSHYNGRLFVTTPRRRNGIPSTLNYIDLLADGHVTSPKWRAYPDFHLNQFNESSEGIVSVYRTKVDACKRLWFIDTGMLEYPNDRQQLKRPSIWIMDLTTDRKIRRTEIPEHIVATGNGLASLSVDVEASDCGKAFAYIPDLSNRQLHVYSYESGRIWTFKHNYFNVDPASGDLVVGGQTFRWNDGIFSTTLGPRRVDGSCDIYFHPMASNNEFVVLNRVLQLESNAARSDHGNDFRLLGSRGEKKQSTMHVCDRNTGVIFYNEIQRNGVGCWNTNRSFSADHHGVVIEDDRMIYPSDLTLDNEGNIWVMSNSMPIFVYSKLDPNEYNFRIWKRNVVDAKRHTICE